MCEPAQVYLSVARSRRVPLGRYSFNYCSKYGRVGAANMINYCRHGGAKERLGHTDERRSTATGTRVAKTDGRFSVLFEVRETRLLTQNIVN